MTACPPDDRLLHLLAEALADPDRLAVESHVELCPACQARLAALTSDPIAERVRASDDPPGASVGDVVTRVTPPRQGPAACPEIPGYDILAEIGRGGMGVVYKAYQASLHRQVALKLILAGHYAGPEAMLRFVAEAETAAGLRHQGIVQVYESGRHAGLLFYTMEYIGGGSLAERLKDGPVPAAEAARLGLALADALAHAHAAGVVHRDLKPGNILVADDGSPKVTDFGLALRVGGGDGLTRTGAVMGTPGYMPPEQARGDRPAIGPAADIYSLGAILYALLTGRPPFRGDDPLSTLSLVLHSDPARPRSVCPGIPRDLETVCLKCLAKEPGRRYASARDLADDLRRFLDGRPVTARRVGPAELAWRSARRNPAVAGLLTAVFGLVTAVAVVAVVAAVRIDDARRAADANADAARSALTKEAAATAAAVREAAAAEEAAKFLAGLFEPGDRLSLGAASLDFRGGRGDPIRAADLLARGVARLNSDAGLQTQPVVRARLLHQVGVISFGLGDLPTARRLLADALALRRAHLPPDHPDLADTLVAVAQIGYLTEDERAADQYREALRILRAGDPDGLAAAEAETGLALCYTLWDVPPAEVVALLEHAIQVRRAKLGDDDLRTISTVLVLAHVYYVNHALGEKQEREGKAIALVGPIFARLNESTANPRLKEVVRLAGECVAAYAKASLGLDVGRGVLQAGQRLAREVERALGPTHFLTLMIQQELARLLVGRAGNDEEREEVVRLLTQVGTGYRSWGHPPVTLLGLAEWRLGQALTRFGRWAEAEEHFLKAVELYRTGRPVQQYDLPLALRLLATCHARGTDPAKQAAVPALLREAVAVGRACPKIPPARLGQPLMDYGRALLDAGDGAAAAPVFAEAAEVLRTALGATHIEVAEALAFRYAALHAAGQGPEAAAARKEVESLGVRLRGATGVHAVRARQALNGKPRPWPN